MEKLIPFIGRKSEIKDIHRIIYSNNTFSCCIFIDGKGGVGKTRFLNHIHNELYENKDIFTLKIIDFDNREYHLAQNIMHRIMDQIGSKHFSRYMSSLSEYQEIKTTNDKSLILQKSKSLKKAFFVDFKAFSHKTKCVLFFDTLDPEHKVTVWDYIFNEFPFRELSNCIFIFAGRDVKFIYKDLKNHDISDLESEHVPKSVNLIFLVPFEEEESNNYLDLKMDSHGVMIPPQIRSKLSFLSSGKPILLDLAADWIIRRKTTELEWIVNKSVSEVKARTFKDMGYWFNSFKKHLVSHLIDTKNNYDRLTLIVSHVFPVDAELISKLIKIDLYKAKTLLKTASKACYYKVLPDGTLSLHDVMRSMVKDYVWPLIDEGDCQKQDYSTIASKYYIERANNIEKTIRLTSNKQDEEIMDIEFEKKKLWLYKIFALKHTLFVDISKGYQDFLNLYEVASSESQFSIRALLLHVTQEYHLKIRRVLGIQVFIDIHFKIIEFYYQDKKYEDVIKKSQFLLQNYFQDLNDSYLIRILSLKANSHIRIGNFIPAFIELKKAIKKSKNAEMHKEYIEALNALGWAYRQNGRMKKAEEKYTEAYDQTIRFNILDENYGWILNNLTFIYSFDNFHRAVEFGLSAIKHWNFLNNNTGLAASHLVLAEVYFMHNQNIEALMAVDNAIEIFKQQHSLYRLCEGYSLRGAINTNLKNGQEARNDFAYALKEIPHNLIAKTRYRIGRLHMFEKKWIEAYDLMKECRSSAIDFGDNYYRLHSLSKIAILLVILNKTDNFQTLNKEYRLDLRNIKDPDKDALSCIRVALARMCLLFNPPKIKESIYYLKQSIDAVIDTNGSLEVSKNLKRRLERLQDENFIFLNAPSIRRIGAEIKNHIIQNPRCGTPLALTLANMWENWS